MKQSSSLARTLDFLAPLFHRFHSRPDCILELLPWRSVELATQLPVVVHLAPAISSPFAPCHVDYKVPIFLRVVITRVVSVLSASAGWEAVDLPLRDKSRMRSHPRMVGVKVFQRILLLVFPLHMLLLVVYWIPPDVQETICPLPSANKERPQIKPSAVLGDDDMDGRGLVVAGCRTSDRVEIHFSRRVTDV